MTELVHVKLHLTEPQMHKLHKGHAVQFKHHQLGEGSHFLRLHHHNAKKIHHARKHKKGVRLQMSQPEIQETVQAGGFGDFLNKLKNAGQWLKSNVIDSQFYQSAIKPIARQLVNTGLAAAAPRLGAAAPIAQQAVDAIGSQTNAFGLRRHKRVKRDFEDHEVAALKQFVAESMAMPRPYGPAGFTAMPQEVTGSGHYGHHGVWHYPMHHHMSGKSFRLA